MDWGLGTRAKVVVGLFKLPFNRLYIDPIQVSDLDICAAMEMTSSNHNTGI